MKILFIPNWRVKHLEEDDAHIQAPDKYVEGQPYWFFKYFPRGTEVDVLDIGSPGILQRLEKKIKFYVKQPIRAFMRRNDYDLVISHGAQSGLLYELLTSFVKHKPRHLMFDIGGLNGSRINKYETPLIRYALRHSPAIIVHSSRQLELYRQHYPNLVKNSTFIPFGADFEYFDEGLEINIKRRVASFGYAKRDFATLCEAFAGIEDCRGFELHIIGDTRLAANYVQHPTIVFHDRMPISDLIEFIKESAVVAIPLPEYLYSYGQMSFLQSMALRKPMIVTETTSSRDYVSQVPGVRTTQPGDVADMRRALEETFAMNKGELLYRGVMNAEYVRNDFNESLMGKRIWDFVKTTFPELGE
ncbi:MAG: glycosyltransferase family 4 protein [Muribaculaceae bacterium]